MCEIKVKPKATNCCIKEYVEFLCVSLRKKHHLDDADKETNMKRKRMFDYRFTTIIVFLLRIIHVSFMLHYEKKGQYVSHLYHSYFIKHMVVS